ncbi:MAG: L-glutamate gamma-semialdehyde dehydrogenase [Schleiferiaceae bacterium]|nr:L-glutamate gamma-semialdehyde dehydrogenase [Schleiferiaceae bacterium]
MPKGVFKVPAPYNEPVLSYAPGTSERAELQAAYSKNFNQVIDIPMFINGKEIFTDDKRNVTPPHDHQHVIGTYSYGTAEHVNLAIDTALEARKKWSQMSWEHRASIFMKAAELVATKYRAEINSATMLAQSKNAMQAEIDAACEFADFLRFNVQYMVDIYNQQPESDKGIWNRVEYRPLEGFVVAITPFNFTAISGNLPASAALMGNVVVWKPSDTQIYSAHTIMNIFREAGLPDGVINMVFADGPMAGDILFKHPDFSGLHFTGSTGVFKHLWKTIGNNIDNYKTYPRIVGETGGKDFIVMHPSADSKAVATGISRGAFEFQGQKCSAASRAYLPLSKANEVLNYVVEDVNSFKTGSPEDFSNFITAVIDEKAFDKIAGYLDYIKEQDDAEIIVGGGYDKSKGYFIEPTVVVTTNPKFRTMCEEIFGPVITIFKYEDAEWENVLKIVDETSEYALTGAIFSGDRYAAEYATRALENAAGNFYINDKPTGAVVGQQPFGGARGSGTNDKAGSAQNLLRWCSPRLIKETLVSPVDYRYPFLGE